MRAFSLLIVLLVSSVSSVRASEFASCARRAAETFQIPHVVLGVILLNEGGWVGAEQCNPNGSCDLGPAQINTIHLPFFARFGVTREQLRDDVCVNLAAAGYLLRTHYQSTGDWGRAITRYHSATPRHAARYARMAQASLRRLQRLQPEE